MLHQIGGFDTAEAPLDANVGTILGCGRGIGPGIGAAAATGMRPAQPVQNLASGFTPVLEKR